MRICHFKSSTTKPTFVNASGAEGDCYSVATSPPLAEYLPSKVAADNVAKNDYLTKHYIPKVSLELTNFEEFVEKRSELLYQKFQSII
ncbi:hypothetical protein [Neobacillus jeddahensis]|uniref:hypothetical protein n=1 Tax=Neobacillus jeddahensis TaxID=1461580 RepID=UPI00058BA455|nr:hypothetical protein [Neobacillus jeddahensis]